jgi:hypothetical protein
MTVKCINKNKNKNKNKKMKRAKFKKPFYGMDNALELIPESYKKDGNQFEITDGVETYEIRWDINEATVLRSENKNFINEDMNKIKHLMGFKSQDTLGTLKGKERIDENKSFKDVWNKTKKMITEAEDKDSTLLTEAFGMGFKNEGNLEGHDELDLGTGEDYELEDRMQRNYPRHDQGLDMADFNDVELGEESPIDYAMGMDGEDQLPNPPAEINIDLEEPMDRFDEVFSEMDEGEEFPDLNNDGEITQADILKGRGVVEEVGVESFNDMEKKALKDAYTVAMAGGMHGYVKDPFNGENMNPRYNEKLETLRKMCFRIEKMQNGDFE